MSPCFDSLRYKFCVSSRKTWNESRSICKADGGDLISIETEEEFDLIIDKIENNDEQK